MSRLFIDVLKIICQRLFKALIVTIRAISDPEQDIEYGVELCSPHTQKVNKLLCRVI